MAAWGYLFCGGTPWLVELLEQQRTLGLVVGTFSMRALMRGIRSVSRSFVTQ